LRLLAGSELHEGERQRNCEATDEKAFEHSDDYPTEPFRQPARRR
jgi:hypothetical protein